jgi:hypothetical protein
MAVRVVKKSKSPVSVTGLLWIIVSLVTLTLFLVAYQYINTSGENLDVRSDASQSVTGNGAPSGQHYNLNIHGVAKGKTADMTGSSGHNIFVPETGKCRINLSLGDFLVKDGNCTDGSSAFQLPNPDPTNIGVTTYSVWARALGKPGGSAKANTCGDQVTVDPITGETITTTYCSVYTLSLNRTKGKSSFGDVSQYLLYIYADINLDGVLERYPLFDPALQGYFWDYENNGMKLVQLRFYPLPAIVPSP